MDAHHHQEDYSLTECTTNAKPKLQWSLNVGGSDNVTYQLPTSSHAALSLMRDQCCRVPWYYYQEDRRAQRGFVEVAIFLASDSNNRIELTVHDPKESRSTCYQLEINEDVTKMELIPLPPRPQDKSKKANTTSTDSHRTFGVVLILATSEGISIFSLVFTAADATQNFEMSECLELSDLDRTTGNYEYALGRDRTVRAMKSKILFQDQKSNQPQQFTFPTLVVVASSLPTNKQGIKYQPSAYNVDAMFYSLRDHKCSVFKYSANRASRRQVCNSVGLLRGMLFRCLLF
jgi:hypothetical protein